MCLRPLTPHRIPYVTCTNTFPVVTRIKTICTNGFLQLGQPHAPAQNRRQMKSQQSCICLFPNVLCAIAGRRACVVNCMLCMSRHNFALTRCGRCVNVSEWREKRGEASAAIGNTYGPAEPARRKIASCATAATAATAPAGPFRLGSALISTSVGRPRSRAWPALRLALRSALGDIAQAGLQNLATFAFRDDGQRRF